MTNYSSHLIINTTLRQINFLNGNKLLHNFPVAVGKPSTPTPNGEYRVANKIINPGGVLGSRWVGLNIPGGVYGIHGTNNPNSIGKAVSNGCIRLHNQDIEQLYPRISIGTPVLITSEIKQLSSAISQNQGNYIVQPQDTLWLISQRFNVSLESLIEVNNLPDPNNIYPGQKLIIP